MQVNPKFSGVYPLTLQRADGNTIDNLEARVQLNRINAELKAEGIESDFLAVKTIDGPLYYWLEDDTSGNHATQYKNAVTQAYHETLSEMKSKYPGISPDAYSTAQEIEEEELYESKLIPSERSLKQSADKNKRVSFLITNPDSRPIDFTRMDYTC